LRSGIVIFCATLVAAAAIAAVWLVSAPAGPVGGCAWQSCDVTGRGTVATMAIAGIGALVIVASFSQGRVGKVAIVAGLLALMTSPFWAHIIVRGAWWVAAPL
jgi:hypothetical protein